MSARLRGLFGRWLAAAVALCLLVTAAAPAAGPLAHDAAKPGRADLAVPAAAATLASGRITVTITASNRGRRGAPSSTGAVVWRVAGTRRRASRLRTFAVAALAPGGRRAVRVSLGVPAGASGAYAVTVCLDVNARIREASGANNCRSAGTVTVPGGAALGEQKSSPPLVSVSSPPSTAGAARPGSPPAVPAGPDTTPPDTSISRGPVGVTGSRTETILLAASEAGVSFECRLDAGAWATCTTPTVLTALTDGVHTFEARATDTAGNTDPTPASRSWTVDGSAPDTSITSGPSGTVSATTASFGFASSKSDGSFECRLDGGTWAFCASPQELANLAAGPHTFQVRAIDSRGTLDASPASRTWTVDLAAPQTTLTSGPSGVTTARSAAFGFSSEAGATFECRVDGGSWAACSSPAELSGLTDGTHTFEVRAIDIAGNPDLTPASGTWTVDATAPETVIDSGPSGTVGSPDAAFTFSADEAGSTFRCSLDGAPFAACASPATYGGLPDGPHTFAVEATDAAGNVDLTPASQGWTVATLP